VHSPSVSSVRVSSASVGVFAPGHLGELTRFLPVELVDDVLIRTRTMQRRVRALPSRTGVYFVLALALFPQLGYARVWTKLCTGLVGMTGLVAHPSEKALRDLRRRLGPAPLRELFEIVAGPLAQPRTVGVCFAGMRTVAFDGLNSLKVPDSPRNRHWLGYIRYRDGWAGYPNLRLMCLVETGTRALLGAVIGDGERAGERDELTLARRLLPLLRPSMLVLGDRGFDAATFLHDLALTGAQVLVRGRSQRIPPVEAVLTDGSYLSRLDGLTVRIIEAEIAVRSNDGHYAKDRYRLITTLIDEHRYPAQTLIRLYHERWEIESGYYALRHTMLGGRVLRSQDRAGLEQEVWAVLIVYQLLRMAMVDAVETCPGLDPDRASFTTALQTARDTLITATKRPADAGSTTTAPDELVGTIGAAVLATLLPARRARYSSRTVKCPTSRYHDRGDRGGDTRPARSTPITGIDITVCPPPAGQMTRHQARYAARAAARLIGPRPPTRRERITALMIAHPGRSWTAPELAPIIAATPQSMRTQLAEWVRLGLLTRHSRGRYTLDTPTPPRSSTRPPER